MSLSELRALAAESYDGVRQKVWTEPDPAAGADFTITVPGPQFWLPVALTATLTTSGQTADRQPVLTITDGTTVVAVAADGPVVTASKTLQYTALRHYPLFSENDAPTVSTVPFPDVVLPTGWTIGLTTENLDAADQWSNIAVTALQITGGQPAQAGRREAQIFEHAQALHALTR